ncbi:MAG: glycosyltransferase family 87 protein [Amnibacterium sp.]
MSVPSDAVALASPRPGPAVPARAARDRAASLSTRQARVLLPVAVAVAAVIAVGFVVRLGLLLRGGGLLGIGAYDDGVYYAAAAQLLHGHLPYRDYVFVQPPFITVLLAPFALLGRLAGDPAAIVTMRLAFELLGGVNAALVLLVLRRFGWAAALSGGLFYAVFYPAAYDERTALLEPIGTTGLLVALLVLSRLPGRLTSPRWYVVAGAALGISVDLKIWYLVPLAVVLAFAAGGRLRVLLGAAAAVLVGYLPFFLASPVRSFTQIVLDQLGRGRGGTVLSRFEAFLGVDDAHQYSVLPHVAPSTAVLLAVGALGAAIAVIVRDRRTWIHVALLLTGVAVLVASPSFFEHYASLVAPPLALVVGCTAGRLVRPLPRRTWRVAATVAVLVLVAALNLRHDLKPADQTVPVQGLQAAARSVPGCIYSDEPTLLAVMDVLSRDLDRGCAVQPDMSGISFDPAGHPPGQPRIPRTKNPVYQAEVIRYLRSGSAFIAVRAGAALSDATKRELARNAILFADGPYVLRRGGTPQ